MLRFLVVLGLVTLVSLAYPVVWDGRTRYNYTSDDLDQSADPFLSVVKGSTENASYYTKLLGPSLDPTPLWYANSDPLQPLSKPSYPTEQPMMISIDHSSIFVPEKSQPQNGFRRTELIAQIHGNHTYLNNNIDIGTTVFHVSIRAANQYPLNMSHEYQVFWIEPPDGSHVFDIQIGSTFETSPGPLPAADAHYLKVRNHALVTLFKTPFTPDNWHNFAIQIDWPRRTLGVFYSTDEKLLKAVTELEDNLSAPAGPEGKGDSHFGVLKLPLANSSEPLSEQQDVVHHGIQEDDKEALIFSGAFVETVFCGVSAGNSTFISPI